ncbi:FtsB family cell division protein [Acanthopleuribacter pedis]|uniref:Septum formation initiator family protein n=1 Tax=Acanthopleuribacter pedis TaxID=442870 RepID=A0A8J7U5K2_9BACT|nr:septum formation initiator family protein [Acanthopleuribacter pedis]MBO1320939.1 septum formation initiator family protein [Acanthopleuribacter pedis]
MRRRRIIVVLSLLLFLSFVASTLFGDSGLLMNMQVKNEHQRLAEERGRLVSENHRLQREIQALKNNPRKIEAVSRAEYGFARPGEVVFYFPTDEQAPVQVYQRPKDSP